MKKIIITGSHLTPALALIDELLQNRWQVTYIGGGVLEKSLLPESVKHITLSSPKLNRHNYLKSILSLVRLPSSIFTSYRLIKKYSPRIIISFGGFIGLPVSLAASIARVPLIIHEQTFKAGLTSRITSFLASSVAISWPSSSAYFNVKKTLLTGNPVRKEILNINSQKIASSIPTIFITGGSQGSLVINQIVTKLLDKLLNHYQVIHQFGLTQSITSWEDQLLYKNKLSKEKRSRYHLSKWLSTSETANALRQADLIIGRAGINTVSEIGYLGKKAILIPLPFAQKQEQLINAKYLKKFNQAIIIKQSNLNPSTLEKAIKKNFSIDKLTNNFPKELVGHAVKRLYKLIESTSDQKNK